MLNFFNNVDHVDSETKINSDTQIVTYTQVVISSESASAVKANENAEDSVEDAEEIP